MDIISSLHLDFTLKNSFRITSFSTAKCVCIRKLVTIKKSKRPIKLHTYECQSLNYYTLNSISITDEITERGTNDPTNWMEISTRGIILSLPCCDIVHWLMSWPHTRTKKKVIHVKPLGEPSFSSSDIHCLLRYICMYIF